MAARAEREMLVVLGLPRSGTTLLTALLDNHSKIGLYYEPWNVYPDRPKPEPAADLPGFLASMKKRFGIRLPRGVDLVGFKETSTHLGALEWSEAVLDNLVRSVRCHVLWIYRDPVHCYLSRVQGAREWWGHPEATVDAGTFAAFLGDAGPALAALQRITERFEGAIVPYEGLTQDPEGHLGALMAHIGRDVEPGQLDWHRRVATPSKIKGDPRLKAAPRPVSSDRMEERAREAAAHAEMTEAVLAEARFRAVADQFTRLSGCTGVTSIRRLD